MSIKPRDAIEDYDEHDDSEAHEKLIAPADWDGPVQQRNCTDVLCLILLVASWLIMSIIGIYAVSNGDFRIVIYPLDYDGNICGTDFGGRDMTEYPYLYYINSYTGGVCVSECPAELPTADNLTDVKTLITYAGIWQTEDGSAELNASFVKVADYAGSEDALECSTEKCFPNNDVVDSWTSEGVYKGYSYAYYVGETYPLFQRCYLTTAAENRIAELVDSDEPLRPGDFGADTFFINLYGDLWNARYWILAFGFGCSLAVSLVYMILLRIPCLLTTLVWFSIFAVIALFAAAGYFAQQTADGWAEEDPPTVRPEQIDYTTYASYALYGIAALLLLIGCCLRGQIQLAIGCVKEAGKAINSMVIILFIPFVQGIGLFLFWLVWGYYSASLASLGSIATREIPIGLQDQTITIRSFEYDEFTTRCGWYMLFCFYWTASFIVAVGDMIVAMAFSKWYFSIDKKFVSSFTVLNSIATTLIYHLGTCAYGSLIIAIIKTLRAMLAKVQKELARVSNQSVANCLLCCCQCCMCCLEKCMKFVNKNAYIQCAIFGTPFCESARKAFFLILRNAARIGAVSYVSAMVLVIGKLFISTLTTAVAYFAIVDYAEVELYSYAGPVILIFIITYFVADMFMDVFEIGILTILHCFVADEEMFGGHARYAEGG
eukprot:CAMPEP_0116997142 /NCGR_PEP_ID=MMETSP0472-20121206/690_1 /TAXON_ID=693140 ORGANISM="Tiarina fusus, Strain LIS" /NCGR_SAMPLE_ID=MMETSP0472 /ASSEMBLY_ACC=CAM_ASM_000603 /LENGTH=659 /DNA_ID=CAMNT_0004695951 /DNA_START=143 /DNA_END=2118 /DNA_ORIENTATION=+